MGLEDYLIITFVSSIFALIGVLVNGRVQRKNTRESLAVQRELAQIAKETQQNSAVAATHAKTAASHAKAADKAVNGIPDGEPRLYDLVASIYSSQETQDRRSERIEGKVDHLTERVTDLEERVTDVEDEQ